MEMCVCGGGNHEEVGFVYAFGGYRPSGTTEWSTKRKTDDWSLDDVTQHWSGGFEDQESHLASDWDYNDLTARIQVTGTPLLSDIF